MTQPERLDWLDDDLPISDINEDDRSVASQQFMHAMLTNLVESDVERDQRIKRVIERFRSESETPSTIESSTRKTALPFDIQSYSRRWVPLVTAAVFLVGISTWFVLQPSQAQAALARTLATLQQPLTRVYDVTLHGQRRREPFVRRAILSTHSKDEFVVSMPDLPIQPALIGSNSAHQWIRFGNQTWRSDDDTEDAQPQGMFLNVVLARQMNFNRLLTEIPDNYSVELLPIEEIPESSSLRTRPLLAKLRIADPVRPQAVKLWPHPETGLAVRMELIMPPTRGFRGIESVTAILADEQSYAPDLFEDSSKP